MEREFKGKNQKKTPDERTAKALEARFEKEFFSLTQGSLPSVLVALSGGADSTALLLLFAKLHRKNGLRAEALHVHHGIRGKEADRDAEAAQELCRREGIPFHLVKIDVLSIAARRKEGIEECARTERYRALEEKRRERSLDLIATAHNAEDLLETMIFRLARGSGAKGLSGIPKRRGAIIRPLLSFERADLEEYCFLCKTDFVTDSTNGDLTVARNRIRHRILPELKTVCPGAIAQGAKLASALAEDDAYLESLVPEGELTAEELRTLPPPLRKRKLAREYEKCPGAGALSCVHLEALSLLVARGKTGQSICLPGKISAVLHRERLVFTQNNKKDPYCAPLFEGENRVEAAGLRVWLTSARSFDEFCVKNRKIHNLFTKVALNSATIKGDLYIRSRKERDAIVYGGMTRQVSKLAAARESDPEKRRLYPVVCDDEGVLWVPGYPPREGTEARRPDAAGRQSFEDNLYILIVEDENELS